MILFLSSLYRKWLYNMKLRHKIMLTYLVLIVCPLVIFQLAASEKISGMMTSHITYSAEQGFDQTYSFLTYRFKRVADTTDVMATNSLMMDILTDTSRLNDISRQLKDYNDLKQLLKSLQDGVDIARMFLYVQGAYIFSNESENFLPMDTSRIPPCFTRLKKEDVKYVWCSPAEIDESKQDRGKFLYVARSIRNPNNYLETIGQLRVNVNADTIRTILEKANVVKHSVTFLKSQDNQIILSSDPGQMPPLEVDFPEPSPHQDLVSFKSGGSYYLLRPIPSSQWSMVTVIPLDEIVNQSRQLRNELLFLLAIIATAAYVLAYVLAFSVTRRISQLTRRLKDIQDGSLSPLAQAQGKDEIGELIRTYNFMIEQISRMNKEQYKLGQEVKSAELKALQSQINPHFLYNTLDLINWMAVEGMNGEIKKVVRALARFYKVSLSNGRDIITIREELSHAAFYVQIQNIRFENKIKYEVEVEEEIMDFLIPKITFQPIVENAILHGILGRPERTGTISIFGQRTETGLRFTIKDDGIGMTEAQLQQLTYEKRSPGRSDSGYGTINVAQRLHNYFGDEYGLTYHSAEGEGTTVAIRVPAIDREEQ